MTWRIKNFENLGQQEASSISDNSVKGTQRKQQYRNKISDTTWCDCYLGRVRSHMASRYFEGIKHQKSSQRTSSAYYSP
ncbi:7186_t:CDS:2 [Cetraspora pellucida]|uniref:7186_t:CDS:1 n=1 Tax=Cetraspora pellucida TaxID=1433469 RepID=A0A9N8Z584_9GLOM|nr:7186_t:CDS:2 [Cetraspora pellucida]